MYNNAKNRKAFFGDRIIPYEGEKNTKEKKYSYIDGKLVHINKLTEDEAVGREVDGGWFAAKKSFGILAVDKLIARAEAQIAREEMMISEDERYNEFIRTFENNQLYDWYIFFQWARRLTGNCYTGRKKFMIDHDIDMDGKATPMFFLMIAEKNGVANDLMRRLIKHYEGGKEIYEAPNSDSTVQRN